MSFVSFVEEGNDKLISAVCSSTDIIRRRTLLLSCDFGFVGGCLFLPSLLSTLLVLKSFSFPYFEQNFCLVLYAITLYKLDLKMHICIILARFCYC